MISVDSILSDEQDLNKLNDLCRLCGNLKDSSALIFDDVHEQHYDDVINIYFRDEFRICRDDALPQKICRNCLTSVESWNQFYINCVHVNEKFHQIVEKFNLSKDLTKKSNDMNTDIEVIEVGVEGDNYDFFNDQVTTNEIDISNIKFTHSFPDSGNLQNFDNAVEDITYTNDTTEPNTSNQPSTDQPEYQVTDDVVLDQQQSTTVERTCIIESVEQPREHLGPSQQNTAGCAPSYNVESSGNLPPDETMYVDCHMSADPDQLSVHDEFELCGDKMDVSLIKVEVMQVDDDSGDGGESKENNKVLPNEYEKFVVQYNKTGIKYMQCDKCQFICRPLAHIFERHYKTHFDESDIDEKPDIAILQHMSQVSETFEEPESIFNCDLCNAKFCSERALHTHQRIHRARVFSCAICGLIYKTKFELKVHKKTHASQVVSLVCNMCGKSFKTKSGYNHHRTNVCVEYKCEICGDMFLVKSVLQDHLKKVHDIEEDISLVEPEPAPRKEQVSSVCPVCGKVVTENALSRHMNLHSEDKPYICDLCGKSFRIKWSLREHIMIEIGMKDYVCEICGKKFVIQAYLNKHMRFHMMCEGKFEGFQCEICGKKYAEEWKVKEHQRNSHKGKNPMQYKCDICDKKYARKWLVKSHKRQAHKDHLEEYQCDYCDKKFTEKWIIKLHLQTVHNMNNSNEDNANSPATHKVTSDELEKLLEYHQKISCDEVKDPKMEDSMDEEGKQRRKPFECELCGKMFATKQGMKNHLYAELNMRKYVCEICGKRYNWWMGLKEHSIMNHGAKEFVCDHCGKDFPTKKRCRDHLSVHSDDRPFNCKCGNSFKLRRYLAKHQKRCGKTIKKELD